MPLLYEISATELSRRLDERWRRDLERLAAKLRDWLGGSRCALVFTIDDTFHQPNNPLRITPSFFAEGHEVLVLEPDAVTVELLHAAYLFAEPQYYLKAPASAEETRKLLQQCAKPAGETRLRNAELDELALHHAFGDYIMAFDLWYEHRLAREPDILALRAESEARAAKKTPWRRKALSFFSRPKHS